MHALHMISTRGRTCNSCVAQPGYRDTDSHVPRFGPGYRFRPQTVRRSSRVRGCPSKYGAREDDPSPRRPSRLRAEGAASTRAPESTSPGRSRRRKCEAYIVRPRHRMATSVAETVGCIPGALCLPEPRPTAGGSALPVLPGIPASLLIGANHIGMTPTGTQLSSTGTSLDCWMKPNSTSPNRSTDRKPTDPSNVGAPAVVPPLTAPRRSSPR